MLLPQFCHVLIRKTLFPIYASHDSHCKSCYYNILKVNQYLKNINLRNILETSYRKKKIYTFFIFFKKIISKLFNIGLLTNALRASVNKTLKISENSFEITSNTENLP